MGKVKGLTLIPVVKELRRMRSVAEPKIPEDLKHYLQQKVFPSRWYAEDDFLQLLTLLASLLPPREDIWEWMGAAGADWDFTHVYSALILKGRPELALKRFPRIWRLYHDNGTVEVELHEAKSQVKIAGYIVSNRRFCRLQSGHLKRLLELGGARHVEVQLKNCADDRQPACWSLQWQLGEAPEKPALPAPTSR